MTSPYVYVADTGVIQVDTSVIQDDVIAEWTAVFGASLNTDESTPQGTMIVAEVTSRVAVAQALANIANQLNPDQAHDVYLDALCALLGLERTGATYTTVTNVLMTGVPQYSVPSGARAKTSNNDFFALEDGITFDASGNAYGTFQAEASGAVACDDGALNIIVDNIVGWATVTNNQEGTPASVTTVGVAQQSDASLKLLRSNTLARQGISTNEAQVSGLRDLDGVTGVAFLENITDESAVINGITLGAHSIWACVDGGLGSDIGMSLLKNKTDGAGWNGAQSVAITDPSTGQIYTVLYDRPTYDLIYWAVTIQQGTYPGDLTAAAPQAIVDYFMGNLDNFSGIDIGDEVSAFEIAAAILQECPGSRILGLNIGTAPAPTSSASIVIAQNHRGTTLASSGSITVVS